jgi:sugar/nucleoside kinase (ribokinase family)
MNTKDYDIVVAGHLCLDINPGFSNVGADLESFFIPGSLNIIDKASVSTGGAVGNTGLALNCMGMKTALIGKIADDRFGGLVREVFDEYDSAESLICSKGETTSYSVNLALPGRDRIILHCPGCNDTLQLSDIDMDRVRQAPIFHFGYPPLLRNFYTDGGDNLCSLFESVQQSGIIKSLDAAYPDPQSESGKVDWKKILQITLPHVDIFVPSIEELFIMLKPELYSEACKDYGAENFSSDLPFEYIDEIADEILELGVGIVLIKCGIRGMYLKTGFVGLSRYPESIRKQWSFRQLWRAPFDAVVLNATGAGDCAVAGFLTALSKKKGPETALRVASVAGWRNIQTSDAVSGIGTFAELLDDSKRRDIPVLLPKIDTGWFPGLNPGEWIGPDDKTK